MDLPNVSIVVQWKATCDMCMLWQQFRRGAWASGQTTTAILLVEKKDTEEERRSRAEKVAKKEKAREGIGTKRKAQNDLIDNRQTKRPALQDRNPNSNCLYSDVLDNDGSDKTLQTPISIEDLKEERRNLYKEGAVVEKAGTSKKGKGKGRELEVVMDDYVNTQHLCFVCWRMVPILYFGNDKTGM